MNEQLKRLLLKESVLTNNLIEKITTMQKGEPEGSLRIFKHGSNYQYYQVGPHKRNYISKKHPELALQLAQKEYNSLLLESAHELQVQLDLLSRVLEKDSFEDLINQIPAEKRKLITPYFTTNEECVAQWKAYAFEPKSIEESLPILITNRGERVRSKSEKIIADKLSSMGIPYRYEAPLALSGYGTVFPDFTMLKLITREDIYWEHFGMMDDKPYSDKAISKINTYIRSGYIPGKNLLLTFESRSCPINMNNVEKQICAILEL